VINDAPCGNEKAYNALRLALQLCKDHSGVELRVFLMAEAANCALSNQDTPNGYYNIERMMKFILSKGAKVRICGGCAEARGLKHASLIEGTEISNMVEFTNWVVEQAGSPGTPGIYPFHARC
jgi:uncharacterized protein involved in oxidation of intracellular sulfur